MIELNKDSFIERDRFKSKELGDDIWFMQNDRIVNVEKDKCKDIGRLYEALKKDGFVITIEELDGELKEDKD